MEAVASPTSEADPNMSGQIIDGVMPCAIQADAAGSHPLFAWIIMRNPPEFPRAFVARLVTSAPTPYMRRSHRLSDRQREG
jgi:hypothetical protein